MIHVSDVSRIPAGVALSPCRRLPTDQACTLMTESFSVETQHGTMVGRPGDYLMVGVTGQVYVVGGAEFARTYVMKDKFLE